MSVVEWFSSTTVYELLKYQMDHRLHHSSVKLCFDKNVFEEFLKSCSFPIRGTWFKSNQMMTLVSD